jgi:GNAT superfamily N-acetyltransferase
MVTIRDMRESDRAYIFDTWKKGLYYGNSWFRAMEKQTFMAAYQFIIEKTLKSATVRVACDEEDNDFIVGYIVSRANLLDWIFVRPNWRKFGVARDLIHPGINTCTNITELGLKLKPRNWIFNPFL